MTSCFLGLDAGSSVTKAALFDEQGRQLAVADRRVRLLRPRPGWAEVDPDEAWSAAVAVIRQVVAEAGVDPGDVAGVGLSAAMVGAWVVDADGNALRPGVNWEDCRAQPLIEALEAREPGVQGRIFRSSGCVMQQGCTLPVAAWLAEHEPELLARAAHLFGYKDFLRFRLTGAAATDVTEASVAPGSAVARGRSEAMLDLFGLGPWRHLLPPVADCESVAGAITTEAAAATGLLAGTPVAVGSGDVGAALVGSGGLRTGRMTCVLGTTCLLGICLDAPSFEPPDLGLLFTLPDHAWYRAMVNVAGTLNIDWAVATLTPDLAGAPDLYRQLEAMASAVPIGCDGVSYLPYLSEAGIVAPVVDARARAQFAGLEPRHGRAHLVRAVYEGVALGIRDLIDLLPAGDGELFLVGGGSRSALWSQMIADLTGRTVVVPAASEFGARGAALIAATAVGRFPSVRAASRVGAEVARTHAPDPSTTPAWAEVLARYRRRRDAALAAESP
jgi:sugar (pentulose or hexulose) kinase